MIQQDMKFIEKPMLVTDRKRQYSPRLLILFIAILSMLVGQTHFIPVEPTGLPYHVIISDLTLDGSPAPDNTEIGLYNDTLCVGASIISEANEEDLDIVTWEGNPTYGLDGFTAGDTILVRVWINVYNVWTEVCVNPIVEVGNGTFGYGSYTILSLTINSGVAPVLDTDVEMLDFGAVLVGSSASLEITLINVGNADEFTMFELAETVLNLVGGTSQLVYRDLPADDPVKRQPDLTLAKELLSWEPQVKLIDGLEPTIEYFKEKIRK